ncbi:extracellular solute-binding protein [Aestuariimicrobium kwangyangense]|uniref:extracellular solute-binding protein n=1 Tax=Aestuariimicrobium kwangyangense TaxID=396389 RepID=UPI0003B77508|nr:extracellular solute-binding protein [Aestuariimicrobium kwangyangense]
MTTLNRRTLLGASAAGISAVALTACGGGSGAGPGGGGTTGGKSGDAKADYMKAEGNNFGGSISWGSWANPGEAKRFNEYAASFKQKYGTDVKFQVVSGDYASKIQTQLVGNAAPDVFYVGDNMMAKLVENNALVEIGEYMKSSASRSPFDQHLTNLLDWCQPKGDGKFYGMTVDCNPATFWFNQDLLQEAGYGDDPAKRFEGGAWTQEAVDELFTKVTAKGKKAHVLESGYGHWLSWMTTFGGKPWADNGDCQIDKDDACMKAIEWMWGHLDKGTMTYGGSLPKGQGVDALFYAKQLATIPYGRWILPNLKELKFNYDIAPYPTIDGKEIMPTVVYVAAMGVNAKAKNVDLAKAFTAIYTGVEGEKARLAGGGNAVPAVKGLENLVEEDNPPLPKHAKTFNDLAGKGYAIPLKIANNAVVASNLGTVVDKWIKAKVSAADFGKKLTTYINTGKES